MENKKNVLFVVSCFYKGGAERFAYEIDKALDKNKFQISILCLEEKNKINPIWKERHYEKLHQELGTSINYIDSFINPLANQEHRFRYKILRKIFPMNFEYWNQKELIKYLNKFDVIHWMGEYTFLHFIPDYIRKKSLLHPMSTKFQNRNLYKDFDFDLHYNFCSLFFEDEIKYELGDFNNFNYIIIPLVMDIKNNYNHWSFKKNEIIKIGIFTRLSSYKPLDPFFYSFQLLLDKLPNCELHIFGYGDPEREGMFDYLDRLGLHDKVLFRGHQEDIVKTANEENLAVSWFQGYNNSRPSGYAGLDICATGTPLICWDFHYKPKDSKNDVFPHYKNLNQFVNKTVEIITIKEEAENLSKIQSNFINENHNVEKYIHKLESEYIRISKL